MDQTLHTIERSALPAQHDIQFKHIYKWCETTLHFIYGGEWRILCDYGIIYIMNNTDMNQALVLSPFESGFVFYPTDKNPTNLNHTIVYPYESLLKHTKQ